MPKTQGIQIESNGSETAVQQTTYLNVLRLLWRRRSFLLTGALAGLVLSTIVAFLIPKEYKSTAQLMPPDPRTMQGVGAVSLSDTSGSAANVATTLMRSSNALFIGILSSRTVQDDLINQFDLRRVYGVRDNASARGKLQSRTTLDDDKETRNLKISVTDNDPKRARDLNAAYLAELNKLISQLSTSAARRERIFLEDRLNTVKENLESTEQALSLYSSRNATLSPATQQSAELEAISRVQGELSAREAELKGLGATYEADNVRVRSLQAQVTELRNQLQKMTGPIKESSLAPEDSDFLPSMRKLPLLGAKYSDLYRNAVLQESLYEMLSKQYETAKVQEAREIPTVMVLDPPDLPLRKSFPPRTTIVVVGTMLAVILAVLWTLGKAVWNVIDAQDPRKVFLIEVGTDISSILLRGKRGLSQGSNSVESQ
jgi:capsule polysaccharide export protein KpsE/RkpR